jgi:hypothetical protein
LYREIIQFRNSLCFDFYCDSHNHWNAVTLFKSFGEKTEGVVAIHTTLNPAGFKDSVSLPHE